MDPTTFQDWLRAVDKVIGNLVGLAHQDFADWSWSDSFDSGDSPRSAALAALQEDGLDLTTLGLSIEDE